MHEHLAFRLERKDEGPFWSNEHYALLDRYAKKKRSRNDDDSDTPKTFLSYYATHAASPYDNSVMEYFLDHNNKDLRFGFVSRQAMEIEFGLTTNPMYLRQFEYILSLPFVNVKVFLVQSLALTETEVLYFQQKAQLVEVAQSFSEFVHL